MQPVAGPEAVQGVIVGRDSASRDARSQGGSAERHEPGAFLRVYVGTPSRRSSEGLAEPEVSRQIVMAQANAASMIRDGTVAGTNAPRDGLSSSAGQEIGAEEDVTIGEGTDPLRVPDHAVASDALLGVTITLADTPEAAARRAPDVLPTQSSAGFPNHAVAEPEAGFVWQAEGESAGRSEATATGAVDLPVPRSQADTTNALGLPGVRQELVAQGSADRTAAEATGLMAIVKPTTTSVRLPGTIADDAGMQVAAGSVAQDWLPATDQSADAAPRKLAAFPWPDQMVARGALPLESQGRGPTLAVQPEILAGESRTQDATRQSVVSAGATEGTASSPDVEQSPERPATGMPEVKQRPAGVIAEGVRTKGASALDGLSVQTLDQTGSMIASAPDGSTKYLDVPVAAEKPAPSAANPQQTAGASAKLALAASAAPAREALVAEIGAMPRARSEAAASDAEAAAESAAPPRETASAQAQPTAPTAPPPPFASMADAPSALSLSDGVEAGQLPDDMALQASQASEARDNSAAAPHRLEAGQRVAQQLAVAIVGATNDKIELVLDPAELGTVRLSLAPEGQSVAVTLVAERAETMDLLRRHIDQLARDLRDAGYSNVTFSFGPQTGGSGGRHGSGGLSGISRNDHAGAAGVAGPEVVTARPHADRMIGLDLRM